MHVLLAKNRVDDGASPPATARPNDLLHRRQAHLRKLSLRANITKRDRARLKAIVDPSKRLASNLEVALISCCEYPESEQSSASTREVKCKHRPQFPSNYIACPPGADMLQKKRTEKRDTRDRDKAMGVLATGKEGHFLKLMLMFCMKSDVGHRALAVAILQRTAQAETKSKVPARMLSFLSAGGLVLLSRWLVEAYTMVVQTQPTMQGAGGKKKNITTQSTASPTGKLLLPLLQLLAAIPFDKELIVASQINKTIKRLKKILDKLIQTADPSSLGTFVHPIAGGLPVVKVRAAIDNVMEVWNQEALLGRKRKLATMDPFDGMRRKLQSRYEDLCAFQSGAGDPPEWMPQSAMTVWVGASAGLATSLSKQSPESPPTPTKISDQLYNERVQHQNAKTTKSAVGGKLNSLRAFDRSNSKTFGRSNSREIKAEKLPPKTFKISWADRPKDGDVNSPRPLHEELLFVPDQVQSDTLPSDTPPNITSAPNAGTLDFAASLQSALNMANEMSNDQATAVGAQDRPAGARHEQASVYPAAAPSASEVHGSASNGEVPPTQSAQTEDDDDSDMDDLF